MLPIFALGCGDHHSGGGRTPAITTTPTVAASTTPAPTPTAAPPGAVAWAVGLSAAQGGIVIHSADGEQTWNVNLLLDTDTSLDGVTFVDAATGWAVGFNKILHTRDGGASWQSEEGTVPVALGDYFAIAFIDPLHGVVVGGGPFQITEFGGPSEVLLTEDGGASWTVAPISGGRLALRDSPLNSVCFTAAGVGLASGGGITGSVMLLSQDMGHTWNEISDATRGCAGRVACAGDRGLWIVGGSTICHSEDGGTSWIDQSRNVSEPVTELRDVAFADEQNGWATGFDAISRAIVLRTTNGGTSWERQVLPLVPGAVFMTPQAIGATSASHAVVVGSESNATGLLGPMALVTSDGGATWAASTLPNDVIVLLDVSVK